ncbi:MAG: helix-turn-helix transcriptional regulator [Alphaproteobacteria bacterium]
MVKAFRRLINQLLTILQWSISNHKPRYMWFQGGRLESYDFKAQLKARGWTQKRFSEETGTPIRTVEDWARGINRIPAVVARYFQALDQIDQQAEVIEKLRARIASLGGKV